MSRLHLALPVIVLSLFSICANAVTVWLAGDSTTASRVGALYVGWGSELQRYLTIPVQNMALAGKSLRSFTTDGYCACSFLWNHPRARILISSFIVEWIRSLVEEGDIVVIEFGHFEGGGPIGSIRHNILCPGLDPTETCER